MDYTIMQVDEAAQRAACTRTVLESLPDWFGQEESVESYCREASELPLWAAVGPGGEWLGLLAVTVHYGRTGDIVVMGVKPGLHRQGVGRALYRAAEEFFRQQGCTHVMVKTLSEQADFAPYEKTRRFYRSMGFAPLVTLKEMWDEENPCLIMIKHL